MDVATADPFDMVGAGVGAVPVASASGTSIPAAVGDGNATPGAQNASSSPAVPQSFSTGGGVLPDGSATNDPSVWTRWLKDWTPQPVGNGPTAASQPAGVAARAPAASSDPFDMVGAGVGALPVPEAPTGAASPASAPTGQKTGYAANVAAGANDAIAQTLGMPVDAVTGILNLVPRGINAATGTNLPTIETPIGGSESLRRSMGIIGANPEDVVPGTPGQALARAAAAGATAVALPGTMAESAIAGLGGVIHPVAHAVLQALAQGASGAGMGAGAAGAVTGYGAEQAAPDQYKPIANFVGNLVGGSLFSAGEAGVRAGVQIARSGIQRTMEPMSEFGTAQTPINPTTGQPFVHTQTGQPITMMPGQGQLVGRQIVQASGQSAPDLLASVPPAANMTPVPSAIPTLGQATGNLGVLGLERRLEMSPPSVPGGPSGRVAFTDARAQQHIAWRAALDGTAGTDAQEGAASGLAADRLQHLRGLQAEVDQSSDQMLRNRTSTLGGNPAVMTEQDLGTQMQQSLDLLRKPVKDAVGRLYDAIDPDGKLAVSAQGVSDVASILQGEENAGVVSRLGEDEVKRLREFSANPKAAAAFDPAESSVIQAAAQNYSGVQSFKDLRALDSTLSAAQRTIRTNPALGAESRPFARISMLRDAVDRALTDGAGDAVKDDAGAADRLAKEVDTWQHHGEPANAGGAEAVEPAAVGGTPTVPGVGRGESAPAAGPTVAAADNGVAPGVANVTTPSAEAESTPSVALAPNLTPEDIAARSAANRAYADYKSTFRRGAVGDVLATGNTPSGFRMSESAVPKAIFKPGPGGTEAADSLIKAAGSPEAAVAVLGDYPAFSFRRAAELNGKIDPAKAAAWIKTYSPTLSKFPGLAEKFANEATAVQTVQDASAAGVARVKEFQDTALARHFLTKAGEPVAPQNAVASLLRSPTSVADARALVADMRTDPAALDGLRRNMVDYFIKKSQATAEAATTGEPEMKGAVFQNLVNDPKNWGVIKTVLGPEGAETLRTIGTDIQRASRSVNATKIPGSPATAADTAGLLAQALHGESIIGQVVIGGLVERMLEGGALSSPTLGGVLAGGAVTMALRKVAAMKLAGLQTVQDLAAQAVIQPELGRLLVANLKPQIRESVWPTFQRRLATLGVSSAVMSNNGGK